MTKLINGKVYELIETVTSELPCQMCEFKEPPHGCKLGTNECCNIGNESKYWRLLKDKD